jgi:DNA-binding MarR family transcriptional regulator
MMAMSDQTTGPNPPFQHDKNLIAGIELLFYAYRDFTGDPDEALRSYGFGRAHHRVVHFVARNPGISVTELLSILKITKQSLSRVLSQLVEEDFVRQEKGALDRRRRLLYLTGKGNALFEELVGLQRKRVARAYREAGRDAVTGYVKVLTGLLNESERAAVLASIDQDTSHGDDR